MTSIYLAIILTADLHERDYCERLAKKYHAVCEVTLDDGSRCDLLSESTAWEVDWARKHYEAVGQSVWYSIETGKRPGIILITDDWKRDAKHIERSRAICKRLGITIRVEDITANPPLTLAP